MDNFFYTIVINFFQGAKKILFNKEIKIQNPL